MIAKAKAAAEKAKAEALAAAERAKAEAERVKNEASPMVAQAKAAAERVKTEAYAAAEQAKGAKARDLKHYYQCYFPHGRYPKEVSDNAEQLWKDLTALGKTLVTWIDANM